jgi:hypothetical protein
MKNKFWDKELSETFIKIISLLLFVAALNFVFHNHPSNAEPTKPEFVYKFEEKVFGHSAAGKEIKGYEIGGGSQTLLLFAAMHGDEMGTTDLLNELVDAIRDNHDLVSKDKRLVVIPISNPDGYYDRTDKLNANGVNLNLNFETSDWQKYGPEGTFAGEAPFSEPESQVIKQVVEQYHPVVMISYHSQGRVISPEVGDASIALAKWYANKTGYEYYDYWDYPGVATKWFVQTTGKPAITVELSDDLESDWDKNKEALLELISTYAF